MHELFDRLFLVNQEIFSTNKAQYDGVTHHLF